MKQFLFFCIFITVFCTITLARPDRDTDDFDVDRENAIQFLKRTFFHPSSTKCEEHKREAKEEYEERCEPSLPWNRNRVNNPDRYCPELSTWEVFATYEIGDGGNYQL